MEPCWPLLAAFRGVLTRPEPSPHVAGAQLRPRKVLVTHGKCAQIAGTSLTMTLHVLLACRLARCDHDLTLAVHEARARKH
jgi:hypothetical protein